MNGLLSSWLVELGLVTWRAFNGGNNRAHGPRPPLPSEVAAVMLVFGALGLVPGEGQRVAGMVGWGLVVATFLNFDWQDVGQGKATANTAVPNQSNETVPRLPQRTQPVAPGRTAIGPFGIVGG